MSYQENLLGELSKAYDQWENLYKRGGSDPFYPDGVNLNLVRNHILYFKQRIEEEQPLYKNTQVFRRELPPKVEDSYMARAEEIRSHAKDSLAAYLADPYCQYLIHHRKELDDEGLKKTSIRAVLNYVQGLNTAMIWSPCAAMNGRIFTWTPSAPAPKKCGMPWRIRSSISLSLQIKVIFPSPRKKQPPRG